MKAPVANEIMYVRDIKFQNMKLMVGHCYRIQNYFHKGYIKPIDNDEKDYLSLQSKFIELPLQNFSSLYFIFIPVENGYLLKNLYNGKILTEYSNSAYLYDENGESLKERVFNIIPNSNIPDYYFIENLYSKKVLKVDLTSLSDKLPYIKMEETNSKFIEYKLFKFESPFPLKSNYSYLQPLKLNKG